MRYSFKDYFKNNYEYDLKKDIQSIIICKSKNNKFYIKPAEICYINHLPQHINASRNFKKLQS